MSCVGEDLQADLPLRYQELLNVVMARMIARMVERPASAHAINDLQPC